MNKDTHEGGFLEKKEFEEENWGKKFEDLTPEEMEKIQGSGDIGTEGLETIRSIFYSTPPYKC